MDEKKIIEVAKKYKAIVTVEEHSIFGGLGSARSGNFDENYPTPIEFVGIKDTFGESDDPKDLMKKYGLGVKDIMATVKRLFARLDTFNFYSVIF